MFGGAAAARHGDVVELRIVAVYVECRPTPRGFAAGLTNRLVGPLTLSSRPGQREERVNEVPLVIDFPGKPSEDWSGDLRVLNAQNLDAGRRVRISLKACIQSLVSCD